MKKNKINNKKCKKKFKKNIFLILKNIKKKNKKIKKKM